jgi:hypothetical protein
MVDPYAPPTDDAPRSTPATAFAPVPELNSPAAPPLHDTLRRPERPERTWRDRLDRDRGLDREARTEPARPGLFWTVAAIGVGLLALGRLVLYFAVADDLPGDRNAPALFGVLGVIAVSAGLALAALLQRGLSMPVRTALMIGAGFFAAFGWDGIPGILAI